VFCRLKLTFSSSEVSDGLLKMSDEDPDESWKSRNKFMRFCMFIYRVFDVPVTAFRGN